MDFTEYQKLAQTTSNDKLTKREHILNGALGLNGESGEVADLIKKAFMQGHTIDRVKIWEEIGDVLWYCAELAAATDMDLGFIAQWNIDKLRRRFPNGFSTERSVNRETEKEKPEVVTIPAEQYAVMMKACHMWDCYKCKHQKIGDKMLPCLTGDDDCETCQHDCPCKNCVDGCNWEWEGVK